MPRRDRTGSAGMGPMTGSGLGGCSGAERVMTAPYARGFAYGAGRGGRPWGGGRGRCFGGGRGRMYGGFPPVEMTVDQELAALKSQAAFLEEQVQATKSRIDELESSEKKETQ